MATTAVLQQKLAKLQAMKAADLNPHDQAMFDAMITLLETMIAQSLVA